MLYLYTYPGLDNWYNKVINDTVCLKGRNFFAYQRLTPHLESFNTVGVYG